MSTHAQEHSITEIQIPTPWGHLATKCWNLPSADPADLKSSRVPPVICLHGWQDNAGTWDKLIPLLDKEIPFICLDFFGHGKSSPRPVGTSGDNTMYVWDVKRLVDFFGLESGVNFMAHSLGGAVSFCFAATFPEMMNKLVTFDAPGMFPRNSADAPQYLANAIKKNLEYEASPRPAPRYTYDQALERFLQGRSEQMTEESARILLRRGLKLVDENEEGEPLYEYARDIRVTFPSFSYFTAEQVMAFLKNISCHLQVFLFKQNHWARVEAGNAEWHERMNQARAVAYEMYKKNCRSFQLVEVDGKHHGHLDHPETVAAEVNSFLKKGESKL